MVLEEERELVGHHGVGRAALERSGTGEDRVIRYEHAILEDRQSRCAAERTIGVEARPVEDDVVRLPVAGLWLAFTSGGYSPKIEPAAPLAKVMFWYESSTCTSKVFMRYTPLFPRSWPCPSAGVGVIHSTCSWMSPKARFV